MEEIEKSSRTDRRVLTEKIKEEFKTIDSKNFLGLRSKIFEKACLLGGSRFDTASGQYARNPKCNVFRAGKEDAIQWAGDAPYQDLSTFSVLKQGDGWTLVDIPGHQPGIITYDKEGKFFIIFNDDVPYKIEDLL